MFLVRVALRCIAWHGCGRVSLPRLGSEAEVTKAGLKRMEGKNYIVEDGDIIFFKFNAPSGGKAKKKDK